MKLIKIYDIEADFGAYEFNNGHVLFMTTGRGGFVVEGGLGYYAPSSKHVKMQNGRAFNVDTGAIDEDREDWLRKQMRKAANVANDQSNWADAKQLEGWHPELKEMADRAFYTSENSKYSLLNYKETA